MVAIVAKIQPLYTSTELNLRVLGEVENGFIASPGRGGHSGLMLQNCASQPSRNDEEFCSSGWGQGC